MSHTEILTKVCRAIDIISDAAGAIEGLFPSMLDLETFSIPESLPPKIAGQRNEDRSYPGSNLMHDHILLRTIYTLGRAVGRKDYTDAADRYLKRFATHCTDTVTGLFPWGEHSFWNTAEDHVGNSFPLAYGWWKHPAIHDHLRAAPFWLWEKLWEYNPSCVERFAEGLDYHFKEGEPAEYTRHANIELKVRLPREGRSCDFPRHGGFYMMDWAFAYVRTGREDFLGQIRRMLDYWWDRRDANDMLPLESRTPESVTAIYGLTSPGQSNSLAMSLLETSEFLEKSHPDLASTMRERGETYARTYLSLPHDLENGVYVTCTKQDTGEVAGTASAWGSVYGSGTAAGIASWSLGIYRYTGEHGFIRLAESIGRGYLDGTLPEGIAIPISDAGATIAFLADLYEISGGKSWLDGATSVAEALIPVYFDRDLPRGERGIDYYDSQMGPGYLLYALSRLALLADSRDACPLEADYSGR